MPGCVPSSTTVSPARRELCAPAVGIGAAAEVAVMHEEGQGGADPGVLVDDEQQELAARASAPAPSRRTSSRRRAGAGDRSQRRSRRRRRSPARTASRACRPPAPASRSPAPAARALASSRSGVLPPMPYSAPKMSSAVTVAAGRASSTISGGAARAGAGVEHASAAGGQELLAGQRDRQAEAEHDVQDDGAGHRPHGERRAHGAPPLPGEAREGDGQRREDQRPPSHGPTSRAIRSRSRSGGDPSVRPFRRT